MQAARQNWEGCPSPPLMTLALGSFDAQVKRTWMCTSWSLACRTIPLFVFDSFGYSLPDMVVGLALAVSAL